MAPEQVILRGSRTYQRDCRKFLCRGGEAYERTGSGQNKETLLEVINNNSISEDQKQYAVDSMNAMVDAAEREASAELLLDSKGFLDAVVSISDGTADVVINQAEISEAERAQIEDIVKRKTNISGKISSSPRDSPEERKNPVDRALFRW
ncbi:MAG: SpoIIIAH-like family protein [Lachnospiraceae bacterium]